MNGGRRMDLSINKVFANTKTSGILNKKSSFCGETANTTNDDTFIKTDIDIKIGLIKDKLSGNIDNMPFELSHKSGFLKSDSLKGSINNKDVNLNYKRDFLMNEKISGTIGNKNLDLKIHHKFWGGLKIKGKYDNKEFNYNVKEGLLGYKIQGDKADLQVKGKNIFSNDFAISGKYNDDKEMLPILLDVLSIDRQELNYRDYAASSLKALLPLCLMPINFC